MAIPLRVRDRRQIVVPVRFARAVTGPAQRDAPDVDDRGFAMGQRPGTWSHAVSRGAMVTMVVGDTVRVRVLTEDIDADAPLFVRSTNAGIVAVDTPASGTRLGADGIVRLRGVLDTIGRPVSIEVRFGAADGPVLGELEPHVFTLRRLPVVAHLVDVDGPLEPGEPRATLQRTRDDVPPMFEVVNAIWRAAGIEFVLEDVRADTIALSIQGQVTQFSDKDPNPDNRKDPDRESRLVLDRLHVDRVINVCFIRRFIQVVVKDNPVPGGDPIVSTVETRAGATLSRKDAGAGRKPGVLLVDQDKGGNAPTLAHELGHYLDLAQHADELPAGFDKRLDIWTCRRMMLSTRPPAAPPFPRFRNDPGYGPNEVGGFITAKNFDADPNDGEMAQARATALSEASLLRRPKG